MNKIWSYFLARKTDSPEDTRLRAIYASWFRQSFPADEFDGTERAVYEALRFPEQFGSALNEKYIDTYLHTTFKELIVTQNIILDGVEPLANKQDISQVETFVMESRDTFYIKYQELLSNTVELDEFVADMIEFMEDRLRERITEIYTKGFNILDTPEDGLLGAQDSLEYTSQQIDYLQEIYSRSKLEELAPESLEAQQSKRRFVLKTGIPAIDEDTAGLYTREIVGIEADAGMGKTKFAVGVVGYQAAVVYKQNVVFLAIEQATDEIEANFIARHYYTLYNELMDANLIFKDRVPEKYKQRVEAAKLDLFESGKYGKIHIKGNADIYIENYISTLKRIDRLKGPFDVIITDYMALIEQEEAKTGVYRKSMVEYEIIRKAYRQLKKYALHYDKLCIAINQLNASGGEKSRKGLDLTTSDAQGGKEVYRSTDYNISIVATPEMEAKELREIVSPKKRNTKGLKRTLLRTKLGSCVWQQAPRNTL